MANINWKQYYAIKRELAKPQHKMTWRNVRIVSASLNPVVNGDKTYIAILLSGAKEMISADIMDIKI